jgi:hypothetical protein
MKATFTRASGKLPGFSWLAAGFAFVVAIASLLVAQPASAAQPPVNLGAVAAKAQSDLTAAYNDAVFIWARRCQAEPQAPRWAMSR